MTLLSILGSNSIAVPLSASFPATELRYILNNSDALMLLSSDKFQSKSDEVLKEGLDKKPISSTIDKKIEGNQSGESIQLEETSDDQSGLMLYTSGTTSRPVSNLLMLTLYGPNKITERCRSSRIRPYRPKPITPASMELHTKRPSPPRPSSSPHPWHNQRSPDTSLCRLHHRIPLPFQRPSGLGTPCCPFPSR